jgi:glycosyltransferase involved in cell wall biosynthesis
MNSKKTPTQICHMTSVHPATDIRIFYKECQSLAKAGYNVSLIAPQEKSEKKEGVRIIGISPSQRGRFFRMTVDVWKVFQASLKEDARVYHFHDPELIPVGLLLRILGNKVIYDIHENNPVNIQSRYWIPLWMRKPVSWLFKRFENFSARYFNYLVSAESAVAERFEPINNNTITVQNFALLEEFSITDNEIPWKDRLDAVVYCGGIDIYHGIREMVEAIELVQRKFDAHLILAGRFSPECLKRKIQNLPGWKNVEYRGILSRKEIVKLLRQVKIGIALMHPELQNLLSYPTKLFEYMAASIPVIVSDFPLWREIIDYAGCGLLVNLLNSRAIVDSIVYLFEHPEEADAMGKRGRKAIIERYNWSNEEKKLLRLYKNLIG